MLFAGITFSACGEKKKPQELFTLPEDKTESLSGVSGVKEYGDFSYIADYDRDFVTVVAYEGKDDDVKIPSRIENLPVTAIEKEAFSQCDALTITIPESINDIKESAFSKCYYLKEYILTGNNSSYSVADGVLYNKEQKRLISYPSGKNESEFTLPASVTEVSANAFSYVGALTKVVFSQSVISLNAYTFNCCPALSVISLGDGLASFDPIAVFASDSLKSIEVSKNNKSFSSQNGILYNIQKTRLICYPCGIQDESFIVPETVDSIGNYAFYNNNYLKRVTLSEMTENIYSCAFAYSSVEEVDFPSSLREIADNAFYFCENLKAVNLSEGLEKIGNAAFGECASLEEVSLPASLGQLGEGAFLSCKSLRKVSGTAAVAEISNYTFSGCESLTEFIMAEGLETVGNYAFYGCRAYALSALPDTLERIGAHAFDQTAWGGAQLPAGLSEIGDFAFANIASLKNVLIPDSVTEMGEGVFYSCTGLESITVGNGVTNIDDECFYGCISLESAVIGTSVVKIDDAAFYNCCDLISVNIPDGVTLIRDYAFYGCKSLTEINTGKNTKKICYGAFAECSSLKKVILGEKLRKIEEQAFFNCDGLAEVMHGGNVPEGCNIHESNAKLLEILNEA